MEGLFTLLALSIVMAITWVSFQNGGKVYRSSTLIDTPSVFRSFVVGSLPLALTLSASQLRLISSVGMGVLVGTSLIVIIPEGVDTLYSTKLHSGHKDVSSRAVADTNWKRDIPVMTATTDSNAEDPVLPLSDSVPGLLATPKPAIHVTRDEQLDLHERKEETSQDKASEDHDEESSPHAWIGVALVSGFILMYLIDKLPEFASTPRQQRPPYHISLDNLSSGLRRTSSPSREGGLLDAATSPRRSHSFATTTGLVIHAAADGIALGASSSDAGLSFIIFLAIMVHKAPASFGLTSVLLKQGLSSRAARTHLFVFSMAAPVGALATFLFVHLTGSGSGDTTTTHWRTGMLLLFSAGTFLYVAMHTMQENSPNSSSREMHVNGYGDSRDAPFNSDKSMRDLIASVIGMILPMFLQIGHAH